MNYSSLKCWFYSYWLLSAKKQTQTREILKYVWLSTMTNIEPKPSAKDYNLQSITKETHIVNDFQTWKKIVVISILHDTEYCKKYLCRHFFRYILNNLMC